MNIPESIKQRYIHSVRNPSGYSVNSKFKVGDIVCHKDGEPLVIVEITVSEYGNTWYHTRTLTGNLGGAYKPEQIETAEA